MLTDEDRKILFGDPSHPNPPRGILTDPVNKTPPSGEAFVTLHRVENGRLIRVGGPYGIRDRRAGYWCVAKAED